MNKIKLNWAKQIRDKFKESMKYHDGDLEKQQFINDLFTPLLDYADLKEKELMERFNKEGKVVNCVDCEGEISIFAAFIDPNDDAYCKDCATQKLKLRD